MMERAASPQVVLDDVPNGVFYVKTKLLEYYTLYESSISIVF